MTPAPDELNIKVATAIGWKEIRSLTVPVPRTFQDVRYRLIGINPKGVRDDVPNFCSDLNAMAQAEATLTEEEYEKFERSLIENTRDFSNPRTSAQIARSIISATAHQRALALSKVKGVL